MYSVGLSKINKFQDTEVHLATTSSAGHWIWQLPLSRSSEGSPIEQGWQWPVRATNILLQHPRSHTQQEKTTVKRRGMQVPGKWEADIDLALNAFWHPSKKLWGKFLTLVANDHMVFIKRSHHMLGPAGICVRQSRETRRGRVPALGRVRGLRFPQ